MLVLRLLVMVLTIICLMDGHAEVSSSTTGMRNGGESPAVKQNEPKVQILDRKKKKKPKPGKKKKPKPGKKKKPKPNKAKPTPTKPVTTTPTMSTSTLKMTTILTTPKITTTATTTITTVSPTTTETTAKITTSTASATTTLPTTTSATTTVETSSTASTTTSTIPTTATTSSQSTTAATTADSGAGGECKATNGKPCIFPFKDGKEEYNECPNEGGRYFWCATSVYDSGKYKHWSYCSEDGPCPLEGDGECRATNNKPCVFPFKDGKKEYNECADHGGQYFWCATGTNSDGKYTAWSKCPKDGSCPLPPKTTTPVMTPTATAAATTLLTTGTSTAPDEIENKVVSSLKDLVKEESKDGTLEMLETMNKITQTIIEDLKAQREDNDPKNIESNNTFEGSNPPSQELSLQYKQGVKSGETREIHQNFEFVENTVYWRGSIYPVSDASGCCSECQWIWSDAAFFDYIDYFEKCLCYEKLSNTEPLIRENNLYSAGVCGTTTEDKCCETLKLSSSGGAAQHQGHRLGTYKMDGEHNDKPVYKQQGGTNVLHYFRESNQFRWSFASSVNSGGGLSSKLGDASVCPSDVKIWQYYWPGTTNLWLVDSTVAVDCDEGSVCTSLTRLRPGTLCPRYFSNAEGQSSIWITYEETKTSVGLCADECHDDCYGFTWDYCDTRGNMICRLLSSERGREQLPSHVKFCKKDMNHGTTTVAVSGYSCLAQFGFTTKAKGFLLKVASAVCTLSSSDDNIDAAERIKNSRLHTFTMKRNRDDSTDDSTETAKPAKPAKPARTELQFQCSMVTPILVSDHNTAQDDDSPASNPTLDQDALESTTCELVPGQCATIGGEVFNEKCKIPFIYEGKTYHGCANSNGNEWWCPTELDGEGNAVTGKYGLCNEDCPFCKPREVLSEQCGSDCTIHFSEKWGKLNRPEITNYDPGATIESYGATNHFNTREQFEISCKGGKFSHEKLFQNSAVIAKCEGGNKFTVQNIFGETLADAFDANNFECDPCPYGFSHLEYKITQKATLKTILDVSEIRTCKEECENPIEKAEKSKNSHCTDCQCGTSFVCEAFIYSPENKRCELLKQLSNDNEATDDEGVICRREKNINHAQTNSLAAAAVRTKAKFYGYMLVNQQKNGKKIKVENCLE